jgi:protein-L-isoaspartate(D-aspartate) O-methyltransferase
MDFAAARRNMVDGQIRTNKVTDPAVLDALLAVPRERFVPIELASAAYVDEDVPLGGGRYLMEPMVFARLLQAAAPLRSDVVLDVGCATGYSTAVLSRLAGTVVALESDRALARRAAAACAELVLDNVILAEGALQRGWPARAPYDCIILGGAVEEVPPALVDQLREGARLVAVLQRGGVGQAVVMPCRHGSVSLRPLFDASIPLLQGFAAEPSFVF